MLLSFRFKDTHRRKTPSNKTQALTRSMNMGVLVIGTLNQLFIRGSYTEVNFEGQFCTPYSICPNISF